MIITTEMLVGLDACQDQVALFQSLTGGSADITEAWCVEHAAEFDWDWAAERLLPRPARAEYQRVIAPALAEYKRVTAPAWAEYKRVRAPAWAEYARVRAQAWTKYERVIAPAWAEYARVRAQAFGRLLNAPSPELKT